MDKNSTEFKIQVLASGPNICRSGPDLERPECFDDFCVSVCASDGDGAARTDPRHAGSFPKLFLKGIGTEFCFIYVLAPFDIVSVQFCPIAVSCWEELFFVELLDIFHD